MNESRSPTCHWLRQCRTTDDSPPRCHWLRQCRTTDDSPPGCHWLRQCRSTDDSPPGCHWLRQCRTTDDSPPRCHWLRQCRTTDDSPPGCHWLCQCRSTRRASRSRCGISLMEVMLATVLMLAAVMALSRVAFVARRHAADAEDRSMAQMLCQNILHEVLSGARPLQDVSPEPIEGDQWVYMIRVERVEGVGMVEGPPLSTVTVQVDRLEDGETARLPTEEEMDGFRLVHWMRMGNPPASVPEGGGP